MHPSITFKTPLQNAFLPAQSTLLKRSAFIFLGVLLLAFASQLSIPLQPVPLTFQSATVILIGMSYGARHGTLVIAAYLIAGALGVPLFADFSFGIDKFFGPTGGYLIGFLPAALISGYLAEKGFAKNIIGSFIAAFLGVSIIFLLGVSWLATFIGFKQAILLGVMPFVISESIKLIIVAALIPKLWKQIS